MEENSDTENYLEVRQKEVDVQEHFHLQCLSGMVVLQYFYFIFAELTQSQGE